MARRKKFTKAHCKAISVGVTKWHRQNGRRGNTAAIGCGTRMRSCMQNGPAPTTDTQPPTGTQLTAKGARTPLGMFSKHVRVGVGRVRQIVRRAPKSRIVFNGKTSYAPRNFNPANRYKQRGK